MMQPQEDVWAYTADSVDLADLFAFSDLDFWVSVALCEVVLASRQEALDLLHPADRPHGGRVPENGDPEFWAVLVETGAPGRPPIARPLSAPIAPDPKLLPYERIERESPGLSEADYQEQCKTRLRRASVSANQSWSRQFLGLRPSSTGEQKR
ncbi:MAG: hypothetical protein R3F17_05885 [Planctomycetota bacterium]